MLWITQVFVGHPGLSTGLSFPITNTCVHPGAGSCEAQTGHRTSLGLPGKDEIEHAPMKRQPHTKYYKVPKEAHRTKNKIILPELREQREH